ncbi:MAG: M20/M25/M40 family metallo-hydrolase [Planctomycetota bacterium]
MTTAAQRKTHERNLLAITGLPTAAGREDRVIAWVRDWVKKRKNIRIKADRAGNLILTQTAKSSDRPIFITAHLDHPAFVVRRMIDDRTVELEFRGGVNNPYFENARVDIYADDDTVVTGKITKLDPKAKPFKRVIVALSRKTDIVQPGDVGRWAFRGRGAEPEIVNGLLHTPACDDLAAVAAALSALDVIRGKRGMNNVGVLLTRAEEIGFIGTLAVCKDKSVPKSARLICLENSRSYPESPIGGGPILRVGDKISVFDPKLTNRIGLIMTEHAKKNPDYVWQRKLMPGGACEATAFSTFGYESTCLCLPLGNYHNMSDIDAVAKGKRPARVKPEVISVDDYHGLIEMLIVVARELDSARVESLEDKLYGWLEQFKDVVYTNA